MRADQIVVGKTYRMRHHSAFDRHVIRLEDEGQYITVVAKIMGGKHPGKIDRACMEWFANAAAEEIESA